MENEEFLRLCKAKVAEYTNSHMDVTDRQQVTVHDVYVVWSCKTLQNNKALLSTNDIQNLYKLPTVFFVYKPGYLEKDSAVPIPGLYAEDVEQYLPLAARYQNGLIEDWNERAVIPYLIKAIQLQHEEIEALKRKVA